MTDKQESLKGIWESHVKLRMAEGWFDFDSGFDADFSDESQQQLLAATASAPRPDFNGKLLINPQGTIWTVIDGHARGWISDALFQRVHFREKRWCRGTNPRICGVTRIRLTPVQSIAFIAEQPPWNEDVGLVRNPAGTVAVFETPRGEGAPVLYGVPSAKVMNYYQFDWDKVRLISDAEFNSYPMRTILKLPDGSF